MFYRTAKLVLVVIVLSLVLAIVTDLIFIFMYREVIRTDVYLAGNFVSTIAQDPSVLATGTSEWGTEIYSDEDLMDQLKTYADASYGHKTKIPPSVKKSGKNIDINYKVETGLLEDIIVSGKVIEQSGVKGMAITIVFRMVPRGQGIGGGGIRLPLHNVHITRSFRVI